MFKHILIPTDGSSLSEQAVRQGVAFAKSIGARVTGVTVSPPYHTFAVDPMMIPDTSEQYDRECQAQAAKVLRLVEDAAYEHGVPYHSLHLVADHPWQAIIEAANKQGCDLIFMASHGRKGVSALVLGSETVKVLTHCKIPVLVCR